MEKTTIVHIFAKFEMPLSSVSLGGVVYFGDLQSLQNEGERLKNSIEDKYKGVGGGAMKVF